MKKSELKSGYLVEDTRGNLGIVMLGTPYGDCIFAGQRTKEIEATWCGLDSYTEDLERKTDPAGNIVKIWGYSSNMTVALTNNLHSRKLLWEASTVLNTYQLDNKTMIYVESTKIKIVEASDFPLSQEYSHDEVIKLYEPISTLANILSKDRWPLTGIKIGCEFISYHTLANIVKDIEEIKQKSTK